MSATTTTAAAEENGRLQFLDRNRSVSAVSLFCRKLRRLRRGFLVLFFLSRLLCPVSRGNFIRALVDLAHGLSRPRRPSRLS